MPSPDYIFYRAGVPRSFPYKEETGTFNPTGRHVDGVDLLMADILLSASDTWRILIWYMCVQARKVQSASETSH